MMCLRRPFASINIHGDDKDRNKGFKGGLLQYKYLIPYSLLLMLSLGVRIHPIDKYAKIDSPALAVVAIGGAITHSWAKGYNGERPEDANYSIWTADKDIVKRQKVDM